MPHQSCQSISKIERNGLAQAKHIPVGKKEKRRRKGGRSKKENERKEEEIQKKKKKITNTEENVAQGTEGKSSQYGIRYCK